MSLFDSLFKKSEEDHIRLIMDDLKRLAIIEHEELKSKIEKNMKRIIELYPNSANAYFLLGILYLRENSHKALKLFNKTVALDPNHENAWFFKGLIYNSRLDFGEALSCLNKVTSINPYHYDANKNEIPHPKGYGISWVV